MNSAILATLIVYSYSSFVGHDGVGQAVVQKFQKICSCKIKLVDAGEGGSMIGKIKLEGSGSPADVVIGIDQNYIGRFKKEMGWSSKFVPFDFGPYSFVYNSNVVKDPPRSLDDLLDSRWKGKIVLEDPRLSSVGIGFLVWVLREKGPQAWGYLRSLKPQLKVISPTWDLAYGLFKKNQAELVFSYWTSPAYHIQEEKNNDFKAALFSGGHYFQTEYMTLVPFSKNKKLGQEFLDFMLSPAAQEEIPKRNFMYPINKHAKLTPAFGKLGFPKKLQPISENEIGDNLETWLKSWREIF